MTISQFREYEPIQAVSLISMYCSIYGVSITEITIPSIRHKIYGVKLHSVFQTIQHKWLEQATGRLWTTDEFIELCFSVSRWIEESPETCKGDTEWVLGMRSIQD
jgi:hypothetical protein